MLEVAHDDRQKDFRGIADVLHTELEKLERLSKESTALTGTPSGYRDLDDITGGFQPGNLIVLAARPSMGKCLPGSALVYEPRTGSRRRIDEVVAAGERGEHVAVATVGHDLRLRPASPSAFLRSGRQVVYRLTTRLGRRLDATANHPLLSLRGWVQLDALRRGDRIAVPNPRAIRRLREERVAVAHPATDTTTAPNPPEVGSADVWWDAVAAVKRLGEEETYDLTVPHPTSSPTTSSSTTARWSPTSPRTPRWTSGARLRCSASR